MLATNLGKQTLSCKQHPVTLQIDNMVIQGVTHIDLTILIQYGDTQKPQNRDIHIQKKCKKIVLQG
jgi:hypothetical protein